MRARRRGVDKARLPRSWEHGARARASERDDSTAVRGWTRGGVGRPSSRCHRALSAGDAPCSRSAFSFSPSGSRSSGDARWCTISVHVAQIATQNAPLAHGRRRRTLVDAISVSTGSCVCSLAWSSWGWFRRAGSAEKRAYEFVVVAPRRHRTTWLGSAARLPSPRRRVGSAFRDHPRD